MSLLVKPTDLVEVVIYIKENANGTIVVLQPEEWKRLKEEKEKSQFLPSKFSCRRMGFKIQNELSREANKGDVWDGYLFRARKLSHILASWDIKDGENQVPVNEQTINQIDPMAVTAILNQYDEICILGKEN